MTTLYLFLKPQAITAKDRKKQSRHTKADKARRKRSKHPKIVFRLVEPDWSWEE